MSRAPWQDEEYVEREYEPDPLDVLGDRPAPPLPEHEHGPGPAGNGVDPWCDECIATIRKDPDQ